MTPSPTNPGEQGSASAKSTKQGHQKSNSEQTASPKRAATSEHENNEQPAPRRAYSESDQAASSGGNTVSHYSSNNRKSSTSTTKKSTSTTKKRSSSSGTTGKKYSSSSKKSHGSTGGKNRTGYSKNSYNSGTRSGNYSYTRGSSGTSSSSSTSSASSTASSDAAAPSSTTTANGAAAPLAKGSYRIGAAFGATGSWSPIPHGPGFRSQQRHPHLRRDLRHRDSGNVGSWAGNYVVIRAADGSSTLYAHMSGTDVKVGQQVTAGQKIGNVGSTGRSFGAHLHFEYYPLRGHPGRRVLRHEPDELPPIDRDLHVRPLLLFLKLRGAGFSTRRRAASATRWRRCPGPSCARTPEGSWSKIPRNGP